MTSAVFVTALVVSLYALFAPTRIGGSVTYVRTSGHSMLPHLREGDLAIARQQPHYRVGDVVAYRSELLGHIVMHRIIAVDNGKFSFKGDNNNFVDAEHFGPDHVAGRLWFRVPKGGLALAWLLEPLHLPLFLGAVFVLTGGVVHRKRRGRARAPNRGARIKRVVLRTGSAPTTVTVRNVLLGLGAASAALAGIAYSRSPTHVVKEKVGYSQTGAFSYDALAPRAPMYDNGRVTTGQVVFRMQANRVNMHFDYGFATKAPHNVAGSVQLVMVLRSPSGWSRTINLGRSQTLVDGKARIDAPLDLASLDRAVLQIVAATGLTTGARYVDITARATIGGEVAGHTINGEFSPQVTFLLEPLAFRPQGRSDNGTNLPASTFSSSQAGSVPQTKVVAATIGAFGQSIGIRESRADGTTVALVMFALAVVLTVITGIAQSKDEATRIAARYGRSLVPVDAVAGDAMRPLVDVGNIDALMHLADNQASLVLHHDGPDCHTYFVDIGGVVYRYRTDLKQPVVVPVVSAPLARSA